MESKKFSTTRLTDFAKKLDFLNWVAISSKTSPAFMVVTRCLDVYEAKSDTLLERMCSFRDGKAGDSFTNKVYMQRAERSTFGRKSFAAGNGNGKVWNVAVDRVGVAIMKHGCITCAYLNFDSSLLSFVFSHRLVAWPCHLRQHSSR